MCVWIVCASLREIARPGLLASGSDLGIRSDYSSTWPEAWALEVSGQAQGQAKNEILEKQEVPPAGQPLLPIVHPRNQQKAR